MHLTGVWLSTSAIAAIAAFSFPLPVLEEHEILQLHGLWQGRLQVTPWHNTVLFEVREVDAVLRGTRLQPALPTSFMSAPMVELVQKLGALAPCWPVSYAG